MSEEELTGRKRRFVVAMVAAATVTEAAQVAGIGERTARRYLADPAVVRALHAALDGALGDASRRAVAAMSEAVATLEAIHRDAAQPAGVRVSAARAILDAGPRLREALDLAERLAALEEKLGVG